MYKRSVDWKVILMVYNINIHENKSFYLSGFLLLWMKIETNVVCF
jgi:hypothetical protein